MTEALYFGKTLEAWEGLSSAVVDEDDSLDEMIKMQHLLMLECELDKLPDDLLLYITLCNIAGEAQEAAAFFGDITKPWKKNLEVDVPAVKEELIDVVHFVLQAFRILGMDSKEVFWEYERKYNINWQRIQEKLKAKDAKTI